MRLHARHGWGYHAGVWKQLAALLPGLRCDDRGYYGPEVLDPPDEEQPHVLLGHSFGAMRMLGEVNRGCRALIAINGFDRFTPAAGFPGVPPRIVDRMLARCAIDPDATADAFRRRCGDHASTPGAATDRLGDDLLLLRHGDARVATALPLLRLDGAADPIVLPAHRAACFAGAPAREAADGGHLLPLTHAAWCAAAIRAFLATVA